MPAKRVTPTTFEDYIAAFSPNIRAVLKKIRITISHAAPEAQETSATRFPPFG
jgi:hypothetical protein